MFYVNDFWYTVYADTVFLNIYINRTRTLIFQTIWTMTRDFQQCGISTSVDSDEPVQPPFKLRNSKWRSVYIEYLND